MGKENRIVITHNIVSDTIRRLTFGLLALAVAAGGARFAWGWGLIVPALGILAVAAVWHHVWTRKASLADPITFLAAAFVVGSYLYLLPFGGTPGYPVTTYTWGTVHSAIIATGALSAYILLRLTVKRGRHLAEFYLVIVIVVIGVTAYGVVRTGLAFHASNSRDTFKLFGLVPVYNRFRLSGTYTNPNRFCSLIGMAGAALAGVAVRFSGSAVFESGRRENDVSIGTARHATGNTVALIAAALVLTAAAFATGSRGGIIVIALTGTAIYLKRILSPNHVMLRRIALIGLIVFVAQQLLYKFTGWWDRLASTAPAFNERIMAIKAGLVMWTHAPWIGTGPGSYLFAFLPYQTKPLTGGMWHNSHSDPVTFLAECGIAGAILVLVAAGLFIARLIRYGKQSPKMATDPWLVSAGGWMLAIPLVHSLGDFPLREPATLWLTAAGIGGLLAFINSRKTLGAGAGRESTMLTAESAALSGANRPAVRKKIDIAAAIAITAIMSAAIPFSVMGFSASRREPTRYQMDVYIPDPGETRAARPEDDAGAWLRAFYANRLDHRPLLFAAADLAGTPPRAFAPKTPPDLSSLPDDWYGVARKLCRTDPRVEFVMAVIKRKNGDNASAYAHLERVTAMTAGLLDIRLNAATIMLDIWEETGRRDATAYNTAKAIYRNAFSTEPNRITAYLPGLENRGLAPDELAGFIPDNPQAAFWFAGFLFKQKQYAPALDWLKKAGRDGNPGWSRLHAQCLMMAGDVSAAAPELTAVVHADLTAGRFDRMAGIARIFAAAEAQQHAAAEYLDAVLKRFPDNPALTARRVAIRKKLNDIIGARIRLWSDCAKAFPESSAVWRQLADSYYRSGDWDAASDAYAQYLTCPSADPSTFPDIEYRMASIDMKLDRKGSAIRHAENAWRATPDNEAYIRLLAALYAGEHLDNKLGDILVQWRGLYPGVPDGKLPPALRRHENQLRKRRVK